MPTLTFDFASNSSLTLTQTQVEGGVAKLATTTHTDLEYAKTYDSDTGTTYTSAISVPSTEVAYNVLDTLTGEG